jgi:hypothetical protein
MPFDSYAEPLLFFVEIANLFSVMTGKQRGIIESLLRDNHFQHVDFMVDVMFASRRKFITLNETRMTQRMTSTLPWQITWQAFQASL